MRIFLQTLRVPHRGGKNEGDKLVGKQPARGEALISNVFNLRAIFVPDNSMTSMPGSQPFRPPRVIADVKKAFNRRESSNRRDRKTRAQQRDENVLPPDSTSPWIYECCSVQRDHARFPGCKGRYMNLMGHRTLNREHSVRACRYHAASCAVRKNTALPRRLCRGNDYARYVSTSIRRVSASFAD